LQYQSLTQTPSSHETQEYVHGAGVAGSSSHAGCEVGGADGRFLSKLSAVQWYLQKNEKALRFELRAFEI
jgi:hypothetical protein